MNTDRRSAGWVSTLVALVVLVIVGFLCGALAGFLWEEPGLVLAYLSGKTEPVEFSEPAVAAEPPGFSESAEPAPDAHEKLAAEEVPPVEPAPLVAVEPREEPEAVAPEKPPAEKPTEKKPMIAPAKPAPAAPAPAKIASAKTPAGSFSVQVGAFADRASADKLVARLKGRGYTSYVKADSEGGAKRYRVRVGPVPARARAEELAAKLAKGEKLPTWILDERKG